MILKQKLSHFPDSVFKLSYVSQSCCTGVVSVVLERNAVKKMCVRIGRYLYDRIYLLDKTQQILRKSFVGIGCFHISLLSCTEKVCLKLVP